MKTNINKEIQDFYCNGFFGRRYDLTDAIINYIKSKENGNKTIK